MIETEKKTIRIVGQPIGKQHWGPVVVQPRRTARLRRPTVRDELLRLAERAAWTVCLVVATWVVGMVILAAQGRS